MQNVFLRILNFGINAGYIVLAVLLLRLVFRKAPGWVKCLLWAVVALRLLLPFSFESPVSLMPSAAPVPADIAVAETPHIDSGFDIVDRTINPVLEDMTVTSTPAGSADTLTKAPAAANEKAKNERTPLARLLSVSMVVWLVGAALLLGYGLVSYLRLRRRVAASMRLYDCVYLCDHLDTSFILGVFRPRIYLQSGMSDEEAAYVLAHERAHIIRRDYWWKPLGFLLLSVYWFQPLLWLAYVLLCRDIECACDEKVIRGMDAADKKGYAEALVSCGTRRAGVMACPLAFGEVGVKDRIKSVLNYKKPAFWVIVIAVAAIVTTAVLLLTVPKNQKTPEPPAENGEEQAVLLDEYNSVHHAEQAAALRESYPEYFDLDTSEGLLVYVWQLAKYDYNFHLVAGSAPQTEKMPMSLRSTSVKNMRVILADYNLPREKIRVVHYGHPLSSYVWPPYPYSEENFTAIVEYMLFAELYDDGLPKYQIMCFDIDGDGREEVCSLGVGPTSGVFSFTITAREVGQNVNKYYIVYGIYNKYYEDIRFFLRSETGKFCVKLEKGGETPEVRYLDMTVENGNIVFSENGVPLTP